MSVNEGTALDDQVPSQDFNSFRYLLAFSHPFRWIIGVALTLLVSSTLLVVGSARLLGTMVERGFAQKTPELAWRLGAFVIALEFASVIMTYGGRRALALAANATILRIREALFAHLGRLPMSYFDRQPLGRTVTRLTYDVEGLEDFFSGTLARLLSAGLSLVTVLAAMLFTNWRLGLCMLIATVPAAIVTFLYRGPVRHWNREYARRNSAINAQLSELLNGLPVIRFFGAEEWSKRKFDDVVDHYLESAVKINVLNSWARPITLVLCQAPLFLLLGIGSQGVFQGSLSLGVFVAFIRYCERLSRPISALAQEVHTIQVAFTSAERITSFLTQPSENQALGANGTVVCERLRGDIEFRDVTMSYDRRVPILRNVSFHVKPGEHVGLAGATGSGKSTTVALLARLYDFQHGEIFLDGRSVRDFDRDSLRNQIGFVSQDVVIFKGTLRENLSFGSECTDQRVAEACETTGLSQVMAEAGLGLDSEILDQGLNLSVGERQLVALTRVLIKNPSLLILDEATANIDPRIEQLIYAAVNNVMRGRSCFIIAHRLATLRNCHNILLFKSGQIVEQGHHEELLKNGGYYTELVRGGADAADLGISL